MTESQLTVAYRGNFQPGLPVGVEPWSTETHVAQALERVGHRVIRLQEDRVSWDDTTTLDFDVLLWTQTYSFARAWENADALRALGRLRSRGVPSVGFHLDRWWGLARQHQIFDEPFFTCDLVVTADGGHDLEWKRAGVEHAWLPPAVSLAECERTPRVRRELAYDVAFVGSWASYHDEWLEHRQQLVRTLRGPYRRLGLLPRQGGKQLRGQALADLYNSVKVVVGDSCLSGGITRYWSDRIPETIGRGGFLVHPDVDGLEEHFTSGVHLATHPLGDWDALVSTIDRYLADTDARREIAHAGKQHVMEHHTYERRVEQVVALLEERKLL